MHSEGRVVLDVSPERWMEAQRWERSLWKNCNRPVRNAAKRLLRQLGLRKTEVGDDWNHWWAARFDHYKFLPTHLSNVVEFGCGPYTNLRVIWQGRQIDHAYCSDPLINTYLKFRFTWLSDSYRRRRVMVDDHPLELAPFASEFFDLVVVINVLDHVQDAEACLRQAIRVTRPGGILVLGQDLTSGEDLQKPEVRGDIGHPIRVHHDVLDGVLSDKFRPILQRVLSREEGREPNAHYGTYLFAGSRIR